MVDEVLKAKDSLLENCKTSVLATVNESGIPNSSYAPIAIDEDGYIYIYISELSKHTSNLLSNSKISMMFIEDESKSENIFARKRITIDGDCIKIRRRSDLWSEKIKLMENTFDETFTFLKKMEDFHLFQIKPISGLLVYGFAKAYSLKGKKLSEVHHMNEQGHKMKAKEKS